ncbi:hypothetical protein LRP49_12790 [Enterovibrio sp. ZSDZ35]|uniref:Uncharacterized protein n=1 Tax=Enterovibrio qingdaonensis TaxID=2899818 RepID=A0ABT5QM28_9GAMM|nr:hypothetical protein [Enterovibrio sp. ZSDZ35]MDD1782048.1 hypothetical protein [Enterovibrio sp. ZSDZ35]
MALPSRRGFNNILIIGILVFIALMNLPTYLRSKVAEYDAAQQSQQAIPESVIALLPSNLNVKALQFPNFTLTQGSPWQTDIALDISPTELAGRWMNLSGTEIDKATYDKLKPSLRSPSTLVVDLGPEIEPLRLTYFQLPQFWLIQNAENHWLAVSVDPHYLFPLANQN